MFSKIISESSTALPEVFFFYFLGRIYRIKYFRQGYNPSVSFADSSLYTREPFGGIVYTSLIDFIIY